MLKETLQKVTNTSREEQLTHWTKFALTEVMPKIAEITKQPDFGFHGLDHTEQVVLFGIDYALSENINPVPVILACALHDCARTNDGDDAGRGPKGHAAQCEPIARAFLEEHDFGLSEQEKEKVVQAIKWHTDGGNTDEKIAACLWDADRTRLSWDRGFLPGKFSTPHGGEVASYNHSQQGEYVKQQKKLLKSINAPSYILMKDGNTFSDNTLSHDNSDNTLSHDNNEVQSLRWTKTIMNDIMPAMCEHFKLPLSTLYERKENAQITQYPLLIKIEELSLLGADYALAAGIDPLPVIYGCIDKYLKEGTRNKKFKSFPDGTRVIKTPEHYIQETTDFLNEIQHKTKLKITEEDKEKIINAVHFPEKEECKEISACINDAIETQKGWSSTDYTPQCVTKYAQAVAGNKEAFFEQLSDRLDELDMATCYTLQQEPNDYTYDTSPVIIPDDKPIRCYHGTVNQFHNFEISRPGLFVTPDVDYASLRLRTLNKSLTGFTYGGKLSGIFPKIDEDLSRVEIPMERLYHFWQIDYPITDKTQFLKQAFNSLKDMSCNHEYFKNVIEIDRYQNLITQRDQKIEELTKKIDLNSQRVEEITSILNPPPKKLMEKIKEFFGPKKEKYNKEELLQEQGNLQKEIETYKKEKEDVQTEEKSYHNTVNSLKNANISEKPDPDVVKLYDFLKKVDGSDNNKPNEAEIEAYAKIIQDKLKTMIIGKSPRNLCREFGEAKTGLLIDGYKMTGRDEQIHNPAHYVILNPKAFRIETETTVINGEIYGIKRVQSKAPKAPKTPEKQTIHSNISLKKTQRE